MTYNQHACDKEHLKFSSLHPFLFFFQVVLPSNRPINVKYVVLIRYRTRPLERAMAKKRQSFFVPNILSHKKLRIMLRSSLPVGLVQHVEERLPSPSRKLLVDEAMVAKQEPAVTTHACTRAERGMLLA